MVQEKMEKIIRDILEMDDCEKESFLKYVKEHTIKYILCMDMGCGGTSTAFYTMGSELKIPVSWRYKTRNKENGELLEVVGPFIPTIIGYDTTEFDEPVIGPEAFEYGRAAENFKRLPDAEALKEKALTVQNMYGEEYSYPLSKVWADYFKKILEESLNFLKEQQNINCSKEELLFVVAHPSGEEWDRKDVRDNYKKMIAKGIGLRAEQIITISEAKAAMQYVRKLHDITVDWTKGVLIIDLGASTIDIEYLSQNCTDPKEYSITMAGREVDKILAYDVLCRSNPEFQADYPTLDKFLQDETFWTDDAVFEEKMEKLEATRSQWMYSIRVLKESICNQNIFGKESLSARFFGKKLYYAASHPETEIPVSELHILEELLEQNEFSFACNDMAIASYMNKDSIGNGGKGAQMVKGSWYSHLEKLVCYALDELQEDKYQISDVIVTGGTSRLVGVEKHVRKGIEDSNIDNKNSINLILLSNETDYERTVTYGSTYYVGYAVKHLDAMLNFPNTLKKRLDTYVIEKEVITKYIAPEVNKKVKETINAAFTQWRNLGKKDSRATVAKLKVFIEDAMHAMSLDNEVKNGIDAFNKNCENEFSDIYTVTNDFLEVLSGKKYKAQLHIPKINIKIDKAKLTNKVKEKTSAVMKEHVQFGDGIRKWWNTCEDDGLIRNPTYRKEFHNAFWCKAEAPIEDSIKKSIQNEIETAYDGNRFNIPDTVIEEVTEDIKKALYLG